MFDLLPDSAQNGMGTLKTLNRAIRASQGAYKLYEDSRRKAHGVKAEHTKLLSQNIAGTRVRVYKRGMCVMKEKKHSKKQFGLSGKQTQSGAKRYT